MVCPECGSVEVWREASSPCMHPSRCKSLEMSFSDGSYMTIGDVIRLITDVERIGKISDMVLNVINRHRLRNMYLGYFKKIKEAAGHPLIMMAMVGGDYHD